MRFGRIRYFLIIGLLLAVLALYFIPPDRLPFNQEPTRISQSAPASTSPAVNLQALRSTIAAAVTDTPTPVPSPTSTRLPTLTPSPSYYPTPTLVPFETPAAPEDDSWYIRGFAVGAETPVPYLENNRIVTFYGNPLTSVMGILGAYSRDELIGLLWDKQAEYQRLSPNERVLPAFQIITTVADGNPGPYGIYNNWLDLAILEDWIAAARQAGILLIIDIQPGQSGVMYEFERIEKYLYQPHVHLALDSEFTMTPGRVPGKVLGSLATEDINAVQEQLNEIAQITGVNKILIIHQFEDRMVPDKAGIQDYPYVEMVIDADGFGWPEDKTHDYLVYAEQPAFEYGGIKLFFLQDTRLMTPDEVMALEPQPHVVIYQ